MTNTHFFKNYSDRNISKDKTNNKFDWLALKQNPWKIFSNYDNKLDSSLHKIYELKKEFLDISNKHKDINSKLKLLEDNYCNNKLKLDDKIAVILGSILIAGAGGFLTYLNFVENKNTLSISSMETMVVSIVALGSFLFAFLSLIFFAKNKSKNTFCKKELSMRNDLKELDDELVSLEKKYNKEVNPLLRESKEINIRDNLDKYYHTDIPELKIMIQEILENYYPKDSYLKITPNIYDDLEYFRKTSGKKHIGKISELLTKIINHKLSLDIGNRMDKNLEKYNLNNNESPLSLIATANGKQNTKVEPVLNFFT